MAFNEGDEQVFAYFFKQWYAGLCFFCNSIVKDNPQAEDLVQEAFVKLWQRRDTFTEVKGIKNFLFRVVRNAAIDWLRHKQYTGKQEIKVAYEQAIDELPVLHAMIQSEVLNSLYQAIEKLPPECRKIFKMLYVEGKNYQQIAEELKLSVNTIRNQKATGVKLLRKIGIGYLVVMLLV